MGHPVGHAQCHMHALGTQRVVDALIMVHACAMRTHVSCSSRPDEAPQELTELIISCINENATNRPTAKEIIECLEPLCAVP